MEADCNRGICQPVSSALDRVSTEAIARAAAKVAAAEIDYDMSDEVIIRVEALGKRYSIRHERDQRYVALRDVVAEKAKNLFRRNGRAPGSQLPAPSSSREDFWALRDVSFEVQRGEVLGIIGRNGAGKTTLLKILSRITEPTEGRVRIRGRVASLLEVGTGFHPELTGRENIYLNGAILGMSRVEIKKKFDEIVAFAETEKFLDTPVKRYSSGMYVRLAFAVAAHLEPEILVVDEVLAVGDTEFQKKCLGKMKDVSTGGRTVLFVSHNMGAVCSLCGRGMVLVQGNLAFNGGASEAVAAYLESSARASVDATKSLSGALSLGRCECVPLQVQQHSSARMCLEISCRAADVISDLALLIHGVNGERVALIDLRSTEGPYHLRAGESLTIDTEVEEVPLVEGDFDIGLYISSDSICGSFMQLSSFSVSPGTGEGGITPREPQFRGVIELKSRVRAAIEGSPDLMSQSTAHSV